MACWSVVRGIWLGTALQLIEVRSGSEAIAPGQGDLSSLDMLDV